MGAQLDDSYAMIPFFVFGNAVARINGNGNDNGKFSLENISMLVRMLGVSVLLTTGVFIVCSIVGE